MGWVTCVKPKVGLSDVACMPINWVRISCSCLKMILIVIFNNDIK